MWRVFYLDYIQHHDFKKDIFRDLFRNHLAPFYGINTESLINPKSLFLNSVLILAAFFAFEKIGKAKLILSAVFFIGIVFLLARKESPERFLGNVSHFVTFSEDIPAFKSSGDVFPMYNGKQLSLGIHNAHYPPTYLFLLKTFPIEWIKFFQYLLIFPIVWLLLKIQKYFLGKEESMLVFALIPALVIFPSLDFVLVPAFFFLLCFYLLIRRQKHYEFYFAISLAFWFLFSFHAFIAFLFFLIYMLLHRSEYSIKSLFLLFIKALLPFALIHALVYLALDFNIVDCFLKGLYQNNVQMNGNSFDDVTRYFLRSTGNVLSFVLGFGPLFCIVIYQTLFGKQKKLALATLLTVLVLSFSGLYFLEADRVWYIYILPAIPLLVDFFQNTARITGFIYLLSATVYLIAYELLLLQ